MARIVQKMNCSGAHEVVGCADAPLRPILPSCRAAEILADRWTLLIVRELLADVDHFNELERGLPGISRSLLADRLRLLVSAGVPRSGAQQNLDGGWNTGSLPPVATFRG